MIKVAQIIDSLTTGGAEMVAVNIANALNMEADIESHLIVTRSEGPLLKRVNSSVGYIFLGKKSQLDLRAIYKLWKYIKTHHIQIIHAHSSSYFFPVLLKWVTGIKIVWHDHYGEAILPSGKRPYPYISFSGFFDYVFCVSEPFVANAKRHLKVEATSIKYLPNFSVASGAEAEGIIVNPTLTNLVMLANIRPQKDHINMIEALAIVKRSIPNIFLYAIGIKNSEEAFQVLRQKAKYLQVEENICFTGEVGNAFYFLKHAQVGVLSSKSEGLPLALIEYGLASIPVVSTSVGQCADLLKNGEYGWLASPSNPEELADGIIACLTNREVALQKALDFNKYVQRKYSQVVITQQIIEHYREIIKATK